MIIDVAIVIFKNLLFDCIYHVALQEEMTHIWHTKK
jgi:hypothetical protein